MYKLLFVVITLFVIVGRIMISNCDTVEGFTDDNTPITAANISDYIYKVYKADVKAIQNLADIAIKLQAGSITVPSNMTVSNQLNVTNATLLSNTLKVKGATTLDSGLIVSGDVTFNGKISNPIIEDLIKRISILEPRFNAIRAKQLAAYANFQMYGSMK